MSGEPGTTDRMVDALLAAHQVPALDEKFASRVLAAAQASPTGPGAGSPWPRRSLRPWRRSPLWLGLIALNIIAASAVAAIVSGIPVWHHVTEVVQQVARGWHREEPVRAAKHRLAPRPFLAPRPLLASRALVPGPAMIVTTAPELRPLGAPAIEMRRAIAPLPQHLPSRLPFAAPGHHHARMALTRPLGGNMLHHPNIPLKMHPHRVRGEGLRITDRRHEYREFPRTERDQTARLPEPPALPLPHAPPPVAVPPATPYGPRLEPQRALAERQDHADRPIETSREARAERRRLRGVDHRPERPRRRLHRGRFNF